MLIDSVLMDALLEEILPIDSAIFYNRALYAFARKNGWELEDPYKSLDETVRRRVICRTEYLGPATEDSRVSRVGLSFTWVEKRILAWARKPIKQSRLGDVSAYLGILLQRSPQEISKMLNTPPVLHGVQGFDLDALESSDNFEGV